MSIPSKKIIPIAVASKGDIPFFKMLFNLLKEHIEFKIIEDYNADYVLHSGIGHEILKYSGVRIYVTGENVTPNFNISDYAIGFDYLNFQDRYLRLPLLRFYDYDYQIFLKPRDNPNEVLAQKTDFCAYVMSNTKDSAPERSEIFHLLCRYKKVNSGGAWNNNIGYRVPDKQLFQQKHKFVIAFENNSSPGYLTEKFCQAASSNTIPIYWGDPTISRYFNTKAFINCHDFDDFNQVVDYVQKIDQDDELYKSILAEPWFVDDLEPEEFKIQQAIDFFNHIVSQPKEQAYRRSRGRWGKKIEHNLYRAFYLPYYQCLFSLKYWWRSKIKKY